ncbi:ANTAR domain-containing protein [Pedococcus bigeumensis]|uniref:ANTAR domain-containing protein n=1 Tax=Pedococcus bigeumensis TaxID=433644 RepID=A0A502D0N0_9MICO|nr:ANTAR domain-containing protein [Pedococcus bigeumensis]
MAADQLAEVFVEVADTLVDDFDVIEFLETLTKRTAEVSSAASAGLLLADAHGQLQYMAASAESVKLLELFQLQYQEGPCLDCFRTGTAVVNTDLHDATMRWPLFAPRAVEAGFLSVHAFPLRHRQKVIGALNMFSTHTGRLEPTDVRIVQALADIATIGLLQERSVRSAEVLTEQLQGALNSRITIEQAKGVLARTHGIDVNAAFERMREYARRDHHRLTDIALAIVTDPTSHPDLTTAGTHQAHPTSAGSSDYP